MKKIFIIVLVYVVLAAVAFGAGSLLAKQNIGQKGKIKITNVVYPESPQAFLEDEVEVEEAPPAGESKSEDALPKNENQNEELFSFAILGDTQYFKPGENGGYQKAVASIQKLDPKLVFAVGDLVSSCGKTSECEKDLNAWKKELGTLADKTYPAQGNHDRTGGEKADAAWEKAFHYLPANGPEGFVRFAYALDFQNSHFVVLASDKPNEHDISKKQLDWLESDLAKNKKDLPVGRQGNIFVFFHEPAYPTNSKIGERLDESSANRDRLWNILTKYKAKAVFSGHEHIQSRRKVDGLYQFVFGNTESFDHLAPKAGLAEYFHIGQAFGLVEVKESAITVKTYSVNGKLLNSFSLSD